jgi:hypothetical protein
MKPSFCIPHIFPKVSGFSGYSDRSNSYALPLNNWRRAGPIWLPLLRSICFTLFIRQYQMSAFETLDEEKEEL